MKLLIKMNMLTCWRHESPPPPLPDTTTQQSNSSNSYLSSALVASPSSELTSGVEIHSIEWAVSSARQSKDNGTLKVCCFYIYMLIRVHCV